MIVVRLLLFSVLLYDTEAAYSAYEWYDDIPAQALPVLNWTIPVEDKKPTDWYYGSDSVVKNETRYHDTHRDEDKRPTPDKNNTDWYYGSHSVDKNKLRHNVSLVVEKPRAVSDKGANFILTVPKPSSDDVRYLYVANDTLTAHGSTLKAYETEKNSKKFVSSSYKTYSDLVKKITKAGRLLNSKTTTETSYYQYNKPVLGYETPTPRTQYYRNGGKETVDDKNKTAVQRNGYNKPIVNIHTTNTSKPYYSNLYDKLENSITTTETSYYRYDKSVLGYETPTTGTPRYRIMDKKIEVPKTESAVPYYGDNKTVEKPKTTTAKISDYEDWRNANKNTTPRNLWYNETRPGSFEVVTTNVTQDYNTTVDVNYNWVAPIFPFVNETNLSDRNVTTDQVNSKTPNSRRDSVKISINSSVNGNEARNYGTFADLLKKMVGYMLPTISNIAPNSNVTNLAIANGNGNVFFYMG